MEEITLRPSQLAEALKCLIPTKRPIYIWGPPGVGKSSIVRQAASELAMDMVDLRMVLLDPVDLRGLPHVNGDNLAHWCQPAFLPRKGTGVLFLDELAQAAPLVQSAGLQLLDRRIGEYVLPEGWGIIAASNRQEDRAGTHRLITPLLNRFIHLVLNVSNEDWQTWAAGTVAPEVRAFLNFKPDLLFKFDPAAGAKAFPTPRSWEFVSKVFAVTPAPLLHAVVAGCVGAGPAAEFVGFIKIYRGLPNLDDILTNPTQTAVPTEPAVCYALCEALAEKCRGNDAALKPAMTYLGRMPNEYTSLGVVSATRINGSMLKIPEARKWMLQNADNIL